MTDQTDYVNARLSEARTAIAKLIDLYFDNVPVDELEREQIVETVHEGMSDELARLFRLDAAAAGIRDAARQAAGQHTCPDGEPCPGHDEPAAEQLSDADRKLLTFALDCAVHEMAYAPESQSDEDRAALTRLRRLAAGTTP